MLKKLKSAIDSEGRFQVSRFSRVMNDVELERVLCIADDAAQVMMSRCIRCC